MTYIRTKTAMETASALPKGQLIPIDEMVEGIEKGAAFMRAIPSLRVADDFPEWVAAGLAMYATCRGGVETGKTPAGKVIPYSLILGYGVAWAENDDEIARAIIRRFIRANGAGPDDVAQCNGFPVALLAEASAALTDSGLPHAIPDGTRANGYRMVTPGSDLH